MISFVCWKWSTPGYRSTFGPEAVNVLAAMIRRHYPEPHRILCVTNDPAGIEPGVEIVPDRADFADIPSPHGGGNPSCYRRLRLFEPDAAATFGDRIVSIDLDCVILDDLRPLLDVPNDLVLWQDPGRPDQYCASMMLLRAGTRPDVWSGFDPARSPASARAAGCMGSDQGWLSYCLGPWEARWTAEDGILSYRLDQLDRVPLPESARVVMFHGGQDPWSPGPQQLGWVRRHYRRGLE